MAAAHQPVSTFIVRIARDPAGRVRAVIERVSSGLKLQVHGCDAIGPAIAQMLTSPEPDTTPLVPGDHASVIAKPESKS